MIITAASFPTPDLVKTTNNPAAWDQLERFAELQAAAANQGSARLDSFLARSATRAARRTSFAMLYEELAQWRYQLAARTDEHRREVDPELFRQPIGYDAMTDAFGRGLYTEDGRIDPELGIIVAGPETPAERLNQRLVDLIETRFAAEAPNEPMLQTQVRIHSGEMIAGNLMFRDGPAATLSGQERPIDGLYLMSTGRAADRMALQREAFDIFADLEERRAAGRTDLIDDPVAKHAFIEAEYCLYQGPEYCRGGDATIRTLLAVTHTRVFGVAPRLPHDIDAMAYVAGQQAFHRHVERTQAIVGTGPAPVSAGQAAARVAERARGLERD